MRTPNTSLSKSVNLRTRSTFMRGWCERCSQQRGDETDMKLALIGYGAMGKLVANLATAAGDELGLTVISHDAARDAGELAESLAGHDVAIDFSVAAAVLRNIEACARAGVPLVEGTTGWLESEADA